MKKALLAMLVFSAAVTFAQPVPAPAVQPPAEQEQQTRYGAGSSYLSTVDPEVRAAQAELNLVMQENMVRASEAQIKFDELMCHKLLSFDPTLKDLVAAKMKEIQERKAALEQQKKMLEASRK